MKIQYVKSSQHHNVEYYKIDNGKYPTYTPKFSIYLTYTP
jgi:hypothetical protein